MISSINLITSNLGKVKEFKDILEPKIKVNHLKIDYDELRSDDPCEIVEEAVEKLANKLGKIVVAEDSGMFIKALGEFPGTCSAYIHKRIGLNGILKLMEGVKDRECCYKSAVGYCEPGKKPRSFLGEEKGSISLEEKGSLGFGHDPIFIPEGFSKTYGELGDSGKKFRRKAVEKLLKYIN